MRIQPPCPPTPVRLIEHYARSMYVCEAEDIKMHFLRLLMVECQRIKEGADPNKVVS